MRRGCQAASHVGRLAHRRRPFARTPTPGAPRPPELPTLANLLPQALARRLRNLRRRHGLLGGHGGHSGHRRPGGDGRLRGAGRLLTLGGAAAHRPRRRHRRGFPGNRAPRSGATRKQPELVGAGQSLESYFRVTAERGSHVEAEEFGLQVSAGDATSAEGSGGGVLGPPFPLCAQPWRGRRLQKLSPWSRARTPASSLPVFVRELWRGGAFGGTSLASWVPCFVLMIVQREWGCCCCCADHGL